MLSPLGDRGGDGDGSDDDDDDDDVLSLVSGDASRRVLPLLQQQSPV